MSIRKLIGKVGGRVSRRTQNVIAPPVLGEAVRFPYGAFAFKTRFPKGTVYFIEASTDLQHWNFIHQDVASGDTLEYLDSQAFKFGHRFYRLFAGEVQSINVIGYATVTLAPGYSMIANPFDSPNDYVSEMFKDWPNGTVLNKFDTRFFKLAENEVRNGKWVNSSEQLAPGEGAMFFNPTSDYKAHSFVGEVVQGNLSIPIPGGFSIRSSLIPQHGSLDDLQFPISNGDVIHLYDRDQQKYVLYPYENGKWTSGVPVISVGESFWVAKTEPGNWTRHLAIK
jgi:hypothetical protein